VKLVVLGGLREILGAPVVGVYGCPPTPNACTAGAGARASQAGRSARQGARHGRVPCPCRASPLCARRTAWRRGHGGLARASGEAAADHAVPLSLRRPRRVQHARHAPRRATHRLQIVDEAHCDVPCARIPQRNQVIRQVYKRQMTFSTRNINFLLNKFI
jgi:hypothetical protein